MRYIAILFRDRNWYIPIQTSPAESSNHACILLMIPWLSLHIKELNNAQSNIGNGKLYALQYLGCWKFCYSLCQLIHNAIPDNIPLMIEISISYSRHLWSKTEANETFVIDLITAWLSKQVKRFFGENHVIQQKIRCSGQKIHIKIWCKSPWEKCCIPLCLQISPEFL